MSKSGIKSIVILTGAGVSAESGLATFRDADGLWEGHRIEEVATPEAFEENPKLVHQFYNLRRAALATVEPNAAHLAIARLQKEFPGKITLVTQNVDDLHERAGSPEVIHMHGELRQARCVHCEVREEISGEIHTSTQCDVCGEIGGVRPDIVWFGEMPYHMERIENALDEAELFLAIGTSGQVYPAAGFVRLARHAGAKTVEINNQATAVSSNFDLCLTGPASIEVPELVETILKG